MKVAHHWQLRSCKQICVATVLIGLVGTVARAQEIRIRVVDGRNGHPITNECVNVQVGSSYRNYALIPTDKEGVALLHLVGSGTDKGVKQGGPACGRQATNNVLNFEDTISVTSDYYIPCQAHPIYSPWISFSVKKVIQTGDFTANVCGKIEATPRPGELVLFVRPRTFLERLQE